MGSFKDLARLAKGLYKSARMEFVAKGVKIPREVLKNLRKEILNLAKVPKGKSPDQYVNRFYKKVRRLTCKIFKENTK